MYAKGMNTGQISDQIQDIYGFDVSESLITGITNKLMPELKMAKKTIQRRVSLVRDNSVIKKQVAYIILGISEEDKKEVLTITNGETESSKYWLSVLNELKNRGVQDNLVLCSDGFTGIKEAIEAAFPLTEYSGVSFMWYVTRLNTCHTRTGKHLQLT